MHESIRQPSSEVSGRYRWVRSSRCTPSNDCVELNISGKAVAVRDSKNAASATLEFAPASWRALLAWFIPAS